MCKLKKDRTHKGGRFSTLEQKIFSKGENMKKFKNTENTKTSPSGGGRTIV